MVMQLPSVNFPVGVFFFLIIQMRVVYILLLSLSYAAASAAQTTTCPQGTYLHQGGHTGRCEECPDGTFMPWTDHTAKQCFDCTKVEDPTIEIVIKPSDKIYDADVQCVEGYYRRLARNPRDKPSCRKCTAACPEHFFPVHPCENFTDIGCCPGENYDYFLDKSSVRMCRERPWMCRRGQYLDSHLNDCKPCPENTFMPEDYHSHTKCSDCHYLSEADLPLHAELTEPCTSIQPPRIGCKEDFYINHGMSYRGDDIGCSPCQTCDEGKYIGRRCDMDHDTVCCDKPNMTVVDGLQGEQCTEINSCKKGTYNPPACDKTCSEHCRVDNTSDVSPCDQNNGICLFGCLEDYTEPMCNTLKNKLLGPASEEGKDTRSVGAFTVVVGVFCIILILGGILFIARIIYIRRHPELTPQWLMRLVTPNLKQRNEEEVESNLEEAKMPLKVTPNLKQGNEEEVESNIEKQKLSLKGKHEAAREENGLQSRQPDHSAGEAVVDSCYTGMTGKCVSDPQTSRDGYRKLIVALPALCILGLFLSLSLQRSGNLVDDLKSSLWNVYYLPCVSVLSDGLHSFSSPLNIIRGPYQSLYPDHEATTPEM